MLPRDTLANFRINRNEYKPQRQPVRITYLGTTTEPKKNPWTPLHDGTVKDEATLAEWELLIPQFGCQCKKFYAEYKASYPPDFSSPESLFAWGVNLHNAVNSKLDRPEISLDEARVIWSR